eukprot:SAG31_NODE_3940_length_3734_cov_1.934801_2_plen_724_part_00
MDGIYTLTNRNQTKGAARKGRRHAGAGGAPPPKPKSFPLPYRDDFESCQDSREAKYFSDFSGAFECHGGVMWQMTPSTPIGWMQDVSAISVIGSVQWEDISAAVDVRFASSSGSESGSAVEFGWLGVRVSNRGDMLRGMTNPDGLFLSVSRRGANVTWVVADQNVAGASYPSAVASPGVLASGMLPTAPESVRLNISAVNNSLRVTIAGHDVGRGGTRRPLLLNRSLRIAPGSAPSSGWVGIGSSWSRVGFDNVQIHKTEGGVISRCLNEPPSVGQAAVTVACGSVEALDGMRWDMEPGRADGLIRLRATESQSNRTTATVAAAPLCLEAMYTEVGGPMWPASACTFSANKSKVVCGGLTHDLSATAAGACASACCNDQRCSVWQFADNATTVGGGCWRGACAGSFSNSKNWVGGARPLPPPPRGRDVRLAACDRGNPRQHFLYDPDDPVGYGAPISHIPAAGAAPQCLALPFVARGTWSPNMVDPTAFSAAVLDTCPQPPPPTTGTSCPAGGAWKSHIPNGYWSNAFPKAPGPVDKANATVALCAKKCAALANCLAFEVYTGDGQACYVFLDVLAAPFTPNSQAIACVKQKTTAQDPAATTTLPAPPASLFTWSPTLGFLVNHAAASGNLCLGVCGSDPSAGGRFDDSFGSTGKPETMATLDRKVVAPEKSDDEVAVSRPNFATEQHEDASETEAESSPCPTGVSHCQVHTAWAGARRVRTC